MRFNSRAALLLVACVSFAVTGCAAPTPPLAQNASEVPAYRLAPGDKLRIVVFGENSLSKDYVVTSAGDIAFPLLGDLPAAGKTTTELGAAITTKLSEGYLNDPRVNIEVLNFRPFYILGEVRRSGEYPYSPELTALQAIAIAGGFTYRAQQQKIFIRRAGSEQELTYELDSEHPVYVMPGDTIRIGERYF